MEKPADVLLFRKVPVVSPAFGRSSSARMLPKFPDLEKISEPPRPLPDPVASWWWVAGAIILGIILLGLLTWGIVVLIRRSSVPALPAGPEKGVLDGLMELRKQAAGMTPPVFGAALSGLVRSFLHRRTGMLARFATTEEILGKSRAADQAPPPPVVAAFSSILESCDAMKYGTTPNAQAAFADLISRTESAIRAVRETVSRPEVQAPAQVPAAPAPLQPAGTPP